MRYLIGVDEAGRGPLAGPVAVGAVLIPSDFNWELLQGVRDSKQLRAQVRERIFADMCALRRIGALHFAVSFSSAYAIDTFGITHAVRSSITRVLTKVTKGALSFESHLVLLDGGLRAPKEFMNQRTIIRGDETEPIISLASIAAKVVRDRHMERLAPRYPMYKFDEHKGYGTLEHRRVIAQRGLSDMHRLTFCSRLRIGGKSL